MQNQIEQKSQDLLKQNVSIDLSKKVASMDFISSAFELAQIDSDSKFDLDKISEVYFAVGEYFSLKWLRNKVAELSLTNYWQKLASKTLLEDLYFYQRQITKIITELSEENNDYNNVDYFITNWEKHYQFLITRFDKFIAEIKNESNPDLAMFIVALNRIKPLCN